MKLFSAWITNKIIQMVVFLLKRLPYDLRCSVSAWIFSNIAAPIAGYRKRIRDNLALVFPDMPPEEVAHLTKAVPANLGRTFIELYSGKEFVQRIVGEPLKGDGVAALEHAHETGRPVMLVTGHIGNYDAVRAALIAKGYKVGGLYKPMTNQYFNARYVAAISQIGEPLFERSRRGMAEMVRFLRGGGMVGIVADIYSRLGVSMPFMGKDAMTSLSAAELGLRYDALVVPVYGIRRSDNRFDIVVNAPVESGAPEEMTRALSDDLEKMVRAYPDQWMWTHRRWKKRRDAKDRVG